MSSFKYGMLIYLNEQLMIKFYFNGCSYTLILLQKNLKSKI